MAKKVAYTNEQQFNAEFKKRQAEVQAEISNFLQSDQFRAKAYEITKSALIEHDILAGLARRLFENGVFTDSLKLQIGTTIESTKHKSFFQRWNQFWWLVLTAVITALATFFLSKKV